MDGSTASGFGDKCSRILGNDPALRAIVARASRVARTRIPVLIGGESGTGKELLAELLHRLGPTPTGPFVAVNCGALPRELAESELFGHERGAFTGAGQRKTGWFEEANGGTLVLDEVGELPLDLQPKLLRVLETGRLRRVGGCGEVPVRTRIVALTLRDLRQDADRGAFRNDLFHRLAGFEMTLPPLRNRRSDIPILAKSFLNELADESGPCVLDDGALLHLMRYDWPGNVRELKNVLRRAAILSQGCITDVALELPLSSRSAVPVRHSNRPQMADGDVAIAPESGERDGPAPSGSSPPLHPATRNNDHLPIGDRTFAEIERAVFAWALARNGGSRRRAARALGVPRSSFCDKVRRHGLV